MSQTAWLNLWLILLAFSLLGFVALLAGVSRGAINELKQTLDELRTLPDDGSSLPRTGTDNPSS